MWFLATAALTLLIFWLVFRKTPLSHIPGLSGWPVIGVLGLPPHKGIFYLSNLAGKFGPVFKIKIIGSEWLIVNDIKTFHEALLTRAEVFSDEIQLYRFNTIFYSGVFNALWTDRVKSMRKIVHKGLRAYGSGLKHIEGTVQEEIEEFIDRIESLNGNDSDVSTLLHGTIINTMVTLLFGGRHKYNSPLRRVTAALDKAIMTSCSDHSAIFAGAIFDMIPFARPLPIPVIRDMKDKLSKALEIREQFFDEFVKPHVADIDRENPRGVIDKLFTLVQDTKNSNCPLSEENFKGIVIDLISGGTVTSTNTLSFAMFLLVHHQNVQKQMQREIDEVVGDARLPSKSDKKKMPYCQAVLTETLRFSCVVPGFLRSAKEDSEIGGFFVPKDTKVVFNISAVHHDPTYWKNPGVFDPTRFLDSNGNLLPKGAPETSSYIPFAIGNRQCIGEVLAKNRIFLVMTSLLQRFTILPPDDTSLLPSCRVENITSGTVMTPAEYRVRIVARD